MVRPGAPAGPQTATTRPRGPRGRDGPLVRRCDLRRRRRGLGPADRLDQAVEVVLGDDAGRPDPGAADPARLDGRPRGAHRDRPHPVPPQDVDRAHVEARGVQADDGDLGLTCGGGGQQVVHVDTALEHHDIGPGAQGGEGRRLPGSTGGDDQDDDHASVPVPPQPRRTTVRTAVS